MEAIYLLVPLSIALVALAAWVFLRMSDSGQFDDMEGPAHSILLDDDRPAAGDRSPVPPEQSPPSSANLAAVERPGCRIGGIE